MEYGPQPFSQLSSFMRNRIPTDLKQNFDFLSESKIITEEPAGANLNYSITNRGVGVLTFFKVKPSRATIKLKR